MPASLSVVSYTSPNTSPQSLSVGELGKLIVVSGENTAGLLLPVASDVSTLLKASPGDVFTSTVLNVSSTTLGLAVDTTLDCASSLVGNTVISEDGGSATLIYKLAGTATEPFANIYIV